MTRAWSHTHFDRVPSRRACAQLPSLQDGPATAAHAKQFKAFMANLKAHQMKGGADQPLPPLPSLIPEDHWKRSPPLPSAELIPNATREARVDESARVDPGNFTWMHVEFPPPRPGQRGDVKRLEAWLDATLAQLRQQTKHTLRKGLAAPKAPMATEAVADWAKRGEASAMRAEATELEELEGAHVIFALCFHEVIRQTAEKNADLARLLGRIWCQHVAVYDRLCQVHERMRLRLTGRHAQLNAELVHAQAELAELSAGHTVGAGSAPAGEAVAAPADMEEGTAGESVAAFDRHWRRLVRQATDSADVARLTLKTFEARSEERRRVAEDRRTHFSYDHPATASETVVRIGKELAEGGGSPPSRMPAAAPAVPDVGGKGGLPGAASPPAAASSPAARSSGSTASTLAPAEDAAVEGAPPPEAVAGVPSEGSIPSQPRGALRRMISIPAFGDGAPAASTGVLPGPSLPPFAPVHFGRYLRAAPHALQHFDLDRRPLAASEVRAEMAAFFNYVAHLPFDDHDSNAAIPRQGRVPGSALAGAATAGDGSGLGGGADVAVHQARTQTVAWYRRCLDKLSRGGVPALLWYGRSGGRGGRGLVITTALLPTRPPFSLPLGGGGAGGQALLPAQASPAAPRRGCSACIAPCGALPCPPRVHGQGYGGEECRRTPERSHGRPHFRRGSALRHGRRCPGAARGHGRASAWPVGASPCMLTALAKPPRTARVG